MATLAGVGCRLPWQGSHFPIRMRPEVQVLPGPLPALTSRNAGCLVRWQMGATGAGARTLTWLPLLVIGQDVQHCCPQTISVERRVGRFRSRCYGARLGEAMAAWTWASS